MNKIKKVIFRIPRIIYRLIDLLVVTPISKGVYKIQRLIKKYSGTFEGLLNKDHSLIIFSLLVAIGTFLVVDSATITLVETESEILSNRPVTVIYNEEKYVVEGVPSTVDIILMGRKSDLYLAKQLSNHEVVLDLSDYKTGEYTVKLKYNHSVDSVTYKLDPSSVSVKISEKISAVKSLSYDLVNTDKIDKKLSVSNVKLNESEVYVKGSSDTLSKVASVKALIDLSTLDLNDAGEYDVNDIPMVAYDAQGKIVDNIEIVPEKATAKITVDSHYVDLPVKVVPNGRFATGYAIESATSSVNTVRVYGDADTLNTLTHIEAEIDVDGLSEDKTFNVTLNKPSGVRSMSETTTSVNVKVAAETTTEIEGISIETTNLGSNLVANTVSKDDTTCTVIVKGVSSVINDIKASNIRAYVDLTGLTAGVYDVPVKVEGNDLTVNYAPKVSTIKIKIASSN